MQFESEYLWSFADQVLVQCPRCASCAHLHRLNRDNPRLLGFRLLCPNCVYETDWQLIRDGSLPVPRYGPKLGEFELELWLQVPCCGEILWAYNLEHVNFLEKFISAEIRERRQNPQFGWSNRSLQSRLPKWMLAGGKRDTVRKGLAALRERASAPC